MISICCQPRREYSVWPQLAGSFASSLIAFNTGCLVGLPSSLIPQLEAELDPRLHLNFEQASWIATLYLIAGLPACLVGGYLSAKYGRRRITMLAGLPLFFSWCMIAVAPSLPIIYLSRFISALAICSTHPSMGVFVSEISHPDWRGSLGVIPSIFLALGITKAYLLGFLFDWRTTAWCCSAGSLLLSAVMWGMKETPYWLVENNREKEACQSLQWYRGPTYDITEEINEIIDKKKEKDLEMDKTSDLSQTLRTMGSARFIRPFSCAGILYLLAQWTGISTMVFYMTNIFQESGSSIDPMLAPVIVAGIRVFMAGLASFVLSFASRRHLFVFSAMVISLSAATIATFSYMRTSGCCFNSTMQDSLGLLPLLATISMFMGHALGVVPVCQLMAAEVFPTEIRTLGSGICVAVATVANAINAKVYPNLLNLLGFHGTFWVYSGVGFGMAVYGWWVIPDNRGLSLVKIEDRMLRNGTQKLSKV